MNVSACASVRACVCLSRSLLFVSLYIWLSITVFVLTTTHGCLCCVLLVRDTFPCVFVHLHMYVYICFSACICLYVYMNFDRVRRRAHCVCNTCFCVPSLYRYIYIHTGIYTYMWGLSNIPSSRIGGLRRACAELARACARAVWLKRVFGQSHHADTLRWLILL